MTFILSFQYHIRTWKHPPVCQAVLCKRSALYQWQALLAGFCCCHCTAWPQWATGLGQRPCGPHHSADENPSHFGTALLIIPCQTEWFTSACATLAVWYPKFPVKHKGRTYKHRKWEFLIMSEVCKKAESVISQQHCCSSVLTWLHSWHWGNAVGNQAQNKQTNIYNSGWHVWQAECKQKISCARENPVGAWMVLS